MSDTESPTPRKKRRQPEHALSVQIHKLARGFIAAPHVFLAMDRSAAQSQWQHAHEAARGVRRGTPDTVTMVLGFPDFWCELKVNGNKTDDSQNEALADIRSTGRIATVAYTVSERFAQALTVGIPFMPGAHVAAMRMDALLDSARAKAKGAAPKSYKARKPRAAPATKRALSAWAFAQRPPER